MTEQSIAAEYNASVERARQLDNAASQLETDALTPLNLIIKTLPDAWAGENAELFIGKCNAEKVKIQGTIGSMRSTASEMRRVATSVRDADLKALEEQRRREAAERAAREAAAREAEAKNNKPSVSSASGTPPRAYANKAKNPSSRVNSKRR